MIASRAGSFLTGCLFGSATTTGILFCYQLLSFRSKATAYRTYEILQTFTEGGVITQSERGMSQYGWKAFDKVWQHRDAWIFVVHGQAVWVLPTAVLSDELKGFIAARFTDAGGRAMG